MPRPAAVAFRALLDCCRWPQDPARPAWLHDGFDWSRWERLVTRHRVPGLAWRRVQPWAADVSPPLVERLSAEARAIAAAGLKQAAEALAISDALDRAGIGHLFLKGSSLERLAYGQIGLKHASDVDVVVEDGGLAGAAGALAGRGYRPISAGGATDDALHPLKHDGWWHPERRVHVELHARLVDNPSLLRGVGLSSPVQRVALAGGRALPTLADAPLFAYLCVHGASHGWSRLKWLADLAAWLRPKSTREVEGLLDGAERVGAGRAAAQALLLCADLLGLPLDPALSRRLRAAPSHRVLAALARVSMAGPRPSAELEERLGGRVALHLSHFLLAPGTEHGRTEWTRKARALALRFGERTS